MNPVKKALKRPQVDEIVEVFRQSKSCTLTSLGEALGQDTTDNCPDQQILRRTLADFRQAGFVTKFFGEQNIWLWREEVYQRAVNVESQV